MIRSICLLFVACLILTVACRPSDTAPPGERGIEQLSATRASLKQAMLQGDFDTIKVIYSDDYTLVNRKGILRTRAERIGMLESGKLKYLNVGEEAEVTIKIYGNVAVVRGVVGASETEFHGQRRESGPRRFTEIWIRENGEWKEEGRQSTPIATAAP